MNNFLSTLEELSTGNILLSETDHSVYNKRCLHHLFEQQVELTPNRVAVISGSKVLTYHELNEKANRLAAYLSRNYNITADKPVGIMLQRSELMIIGILGIMKVGGAYVPIDPNNPADYSSYICNDCEIDTVLTDAEPADAAYFNGINFSNLSDDELYIGDGKNAVNKVGSHNLAYIIYTSGSTGKPKGVMIEHRSIINKLEWMKEQYPLAVKDTVLQKTNFVFDVSVWELLWPLISGARLCFLQPGAQMYPEKILSSIVQSEVTIVHFVPAMLQLFLNYFEENPGEIAKMAGVKRVYTSGEALTVKQANLFNKLFYKQFGTGLTNQYGPTEAAVEVTYFDCEQVGELKVVPIGKAIKNTELYIAAEDGLLLPDGEIGELIIAGIQVARGYKNNPTLTDAKFIINPFSPAQKMYKTGDKARILPDGNIEFFGRIDQQVKINGYRVEPGQIENIILQNSHVNECIVSLRNVDGLNELVAYITAKESGHKNEDLVNDLVADLKTQLPAHMVPAFMVRMDAFPVTPSGKVDRKKLPSPLQRFHQKRKDTILPQNHTQKIIACIWQDALKVEDIGIDDNFFELGGRSLVVAKVIGLINNKFETKLTFTNMFQLPTVRELADKIDHNHAEPLNPIVLIRPGVGTPLFLFPGMGSSPISFLSFQDNYDGNQPLYSILYPDMDSSFPFSSLQEYAAYVVKQMKMITPNGPYALMGYSMGGRLAFEIAVQLQQASEQVDLLAMVSVFPTTLSKKSDASWKKIKEEATTIPRLSINLMSKYFTRRIPYLVNLLNATLSGKRDAVASTGGQNFGISHPLFVSSWYSYQTDSKFTGNPLLIGEDTDRGEFNEFHKFEVYRDSLMSKRWEKHVNGTVINYKLSCDHFGFFSDENIKHLTKAIKEAWVNN